MFLILWKQLSHMLLNNNLIMNKGEGGNKRGFVSFLLYLFLRFIVRIDFEKAPDTKGIRQDSCLIL